MLLRTVLMDGDTRSAQVERLEVVDTGRRRRWSEDKKLKIVLESLQAPRFRRERPSCRPTDNAHKFHVAASQSPDQNAAVYLPESVARKTPRLGSSMSQLGHSRLGRAGSESGHVRCAAESGSQFSA